MPFKTVKGDLFKLIPARAILVHGCNAQGVMESGFAKFVRAQYPAAYEKFLQEYRKSFNAESQMGTIQSTRVGELRVMNAITQRYYGKDPAEKYVSYDAVEEALRQVEEKARKLSCDVYFPFIGGGRANGDRKVLKAIFELVFATSPVNATLVVDR
jgi:O-acetyl-ADP-ribose deacetylase (regulator of RNase III)